MTVTGSALGFVTVTVTSSPTVIVLLALVSTCSAEVPAKRRMRASAPAVSTAAPGSVPRSIAVPASRSSPLPRYSVKVFAAPVSAAFSWMRESGAPSASVPAGTTVAVTPAFAALMALARSWGDAPAGAISVRVPSAATSVNAPPQESAPAAAVTTECAVATASTTMLVENALAFGPAFTVTLSDDDVAMKAASEVADAAVLAFSTSACSEVFNDCRFVMIEVRSVILVVISFFGIADTSMSASMSSPVFSPETNPSSFILGCLPSGRVAGLRGRRPGGVSPARAPGAPQARRLNGAAGERPGRTGSPARASRCPPAAGCSQPCT